MSLLQARQLMKVFGILLFFLVFLGFCVSGVLLVCLLGCGVVGFFFLFSFVLWGFFCFGGFCSGFFWFCFVFLGRGV